VAVEQVVAGERVMKKKMAEYPSYPVRPFWQRTFADWWLSIQRLAEAPRVPAWSEVPTAVHWMI